jgi:2-methylcitrate dehydratase PrpD
VLKSYSAKNGISKLRSFEKDLSKLQFRIGTTAYIHLHSGEILTGECDVPKGFAGDPEKKYRVLEKFQRECNPVYGFEYTNLLLTQI